MTSSLLPEKGAWKSVKHGWRQLYGDFSRKGLSIEHHDFISEKPLNWGKSFHDDSLELCLNLSGEGFVKSRSEKSIFKTRTVGFYYNSRNELEATRTAQEQHSFITLEFSRAYLSTQLEPLADAIEPSIRNWLSEKSGGHAGAVQLMTTGQEALFTSLRQPPVQPSAYPLWYQSKTLEILAQVAFTAPAGEELFCERHKRVSRERIERVLAILQTSFEEPPDMDQLGAQVGCSPFYLSRLFSKEMSMTIPQYIRQLRMERAAELLLSGRHNVTEAAMAVGYSSLSHFSKAFCQTIGCCPVLFPSAKAMVAKFLARKALVPRSS